MIKIVTDSTCDLPADWLRRYHITVVPVNIQFGLDTYQEGQSITPDAFYQRIHAEGILPTTSQPSVGVLQTTYQQLAADGSDILSIHLTSKLSGTWQAAVQAAKTLPDQISIRVIDSWTGSVGLGLLVREAAQLAASGLSLADVSRHIEARRQEINIFILLKDLRFARMSGRVGRVREGLAALLRVQPIIAVNEGALVLQERVRGPKKGLARLVALAAEAAGDAPVHAAVAHAIAPEQAERLLALAHQQLNCRNTFITDLALSIAVHFGPGTVGLATYPA